MRLCIAILATLLATWAWAETISGRVVGVADGDTITVLDAGNQQYKIRLSGIDAPEKNQPFGQTSKQSLSDQVFGRQVAVETGKVDKYGRNVGKVLVDGKDANLEQIKRGLAWHYKRFENEQPVDDRGRTGRLRRRPRRRGGAYGLSLIRCRRGSGGSDDQHLNMEGDRPTK